MRLLLLGLSIACQGAGKTVPEGNEQSESQEDTSSTEQDTSASDDSAEDTDTSEPQDTSVPEDTSEPEDPVVDADGDGYSAEQDCNDLNAEVNPGATEVCDGIDNDCDGVADTSDVCPCPVYEYSGHSYFFCAQAEDWLTAEQACQAQSNYHLVVVEDEAENTWLWNTANTIVNEGWWWLGYHDRDATEAEEPADGWTWVNGLSSNYTNWAEFQPDDYQAVEDCAHIQGPSGTWNDLDCTIDNWYETEVYYVCEVSVP